MTIPEAYGEFEGRIVSHSSSSEIILATIGLRPNGEAIEHMEPAEAQRNTRFEIEKLFIHAKVCVQEQLGPDANSTGIHESTVNFGHTSAVKLPRLSLPTFDGKYCEYQNFILSFNQVIGHQPSMSKIEKFNQLLNCLREPALETVRAFQVTADNYTKARDRLKQRYDNPTLVFLDNILSLFALPTVAKSNGQQLRSLIDNASALYNSLRSLSTEPQICEAMLISIVMGKVDQETKRKWNESLDYTTLPSWDKCVGVVERHCQYLESDKKPPAEAPMSQTGGHRSRSQRNQASLSFNCTTQTCNICSQTDHKTFRCPELINLALDNRLNAVKRHKLCINCLGRGHLVANCPSTRRCHSCALPHHSLLHRPSPGSAAAPFPLPQAEPVQVSDAVAHTHTESRSDCVILATALILVKDASGSYKIGRALLDSCSQVNFISEEFAQRLRLPRSKLNLEIRSIGETQTRIKHHATTNIKSRHNGFELLLDFCVTFHIAYHPESEIDISAWNLPQHSSLADESFNKSRRIDLLLGTETFFDILAVGQVKLGKDLPVLQKTLLGWIVSGRCRAHPRTLHQYSSIALTEIDQKMERLWRIDHVEPPEITLTPEQRNYEPTVLGASFDIAKRRFLSLERSLCKRPEVGAKYVEFMQEFQNLGHMSPVSHPQLNTPHYYIPHHCVLKSNSTSTKLRVVFDASCKTTSQKALNDILMVGPTIQPDLYALLLRFRIHRYAITADVVKMFRQVNMFAEDRRFQYILWRTSPSQPLSTFKLNTVTYGTAAAPYLAIRSLSYLADKFMDKLEIGAKAIKSSFYVDDFLGGADTVEELHQIKREVTAILQDGQLELAKWHSNHCKFVDDATVKHLQLDDEMLTSTLGLKWDQVRDTFMFSFSPRFDSDHVTKRSILSIASSLFDPLGLVTPIIIVAKIILQELWLLKLHWDESVPQGIHTAWMSLLASLSSLESVAIPRYCLQSAIHTFQIHGFCDASNRAYGCCIYARTIGSDGLTKVQLITSKSRVAPTKKLSLPKLELCGAHLLAQLYKKIIRIFADRKPTSFLWCDSQIVLHWNRQHSATLSTFVGNRIAEIQELTSDCHWRHVPTHCNPADILSRGCTITELEQSIWFEGPEFLGQDHQHWPKDSRDNSDIDMETVQLEKRKSAFAVSSAALYGNSPYYLSLESQSHTFKEADSLVDEDVRRRCIASRHFLALRDRIEEQADAIREFASKSGCEFAFTPPRAPHMGGLWEAVKTAKHLLLRAVGSALLNAEELATVLVGIEATMNSRPLGALSQDPSDGEALTPGHLLTGGPLIAAPALRTPDQVGLSCLRRWRLVSSVRKTFWRRWSREYVLGLQVRGKWHEEKANVEEGQLVVVAEDNLLPQQWLLGRIVATHAGEDGKVRVVDLRRSDGAIFRRAIHKLAPLPIC
ncbi:uncharacterized protein LOC122612735 [Drosophila teissieri]|uniref:uncharacterized protein LOC122612735 n=1 Tax=Drosophila teissieri TaxID=7243 RepID=UPI001CBA38AB|nr:uncharacterized protein LOC122612735 [Drosophila teissieri]